MSGVFVGWSSFFIGWSDPGRWQGVGLSMVGLQRGLPSLLQGGDEEFCGISYGVICSTGEG